MRLNPLHLRIALLALNLAAAVGVPAYAVLSFRDMAEGAAFIDIADPADLVSRDGEEAAMQPARGIPVEGFQPQPAPRPDEPAPGESSPSVTPYDPTNLQPGPLASEPHNLEYVFAILRSDPTRNFVVLRKKAAPQSGAAAPGSRTALRRTGTQPPARVSVGGRMPGVGLVPLDGISFFVWERRYRDAHQGLDFMVHSAGEEELVYWLPGEPGRMYALPKVGHGRPRWNASSGPSRDAGGDLEEEPRLEKRFFFHDRKDVEAGIEEEYGRMLQGEPGGPLLSSPGRRP